MSYRSIALTLLLLAACRREEVAPPAQAQRTATQTETVAPKPEDLSAKKIDTTVRIPPPPVSGCEVKPSFTANEPIDFTMQLAEAPAELHVSVRVMKGSEEIAFVRQPAEGKKTVTLRLPKLDPGKYRLEGLWGGNLGCEKQIEVAK